MFLKRVAINDSMIQGFDGMSTSVFGFSFLSMYMEKHELVTYW